MGRNEDSPTRDDLDRIQRDYLDDVDGQLTLDDIEGDLEEVGFEGKSLDVLAEQVAGRNDLAASQDALRSAQREAVDSLSDGGAVGGQIVRAEDGFTPIGAPQNVEQEIRRTGPTSGEVVATNVNTGSSGVIGRIDLPEDPGV